jgi:hypothetical protein
MGRRAAGVGSHTSVEMVTRGRVHPPLSKQLPPDGLEEGGSAAKESTGNDMSQWVISQDDPSLACSRSARMGS